MRKRTWIIKDEKRESGNTHGGLDPETPVHNMPVALFSNRKVNILMF
jgi:hypothetical protein